MLKNKMGYIGILGLLGLLGLITGNPGFYGFFGFFGFLTSVWWGTGGDRRVDRNVDRASWNAFVFTMGASALLITYIAVLRAAEAFPAAFSLLFGGSLTVFVASFFYYDRFSNSGLQRRRRGSKS
jgi:hypothetical protein